MCVCVCERERERDRVRKRRRATDTFFTLKLVSLSFFATFFLQKLSFVTSVCTLKVRQTKKKEKATDRRTDRQCVLLVVC